MASTSRSSSTADCFRDPRRPDPIDHGRPDSAARRWWAWKAWPRRRPCSSPAAWLAGGDRRGPLPDPRPTRRSWRGWACCRQSSRSSNSSELPGPGNRVRLRRGPAPVQVPGDQQLSTVQEALTNALRHSGAKRIRIEVSQQADQVCLAVRDWGRGLNVHAPSNGYGLKGILHRARGVARQCRNHEHSR